MSDKRRLELSVRERFRALAQKLARLRRRSISGLFEDLIEEETGRTRRKKHPKKPHSYLGKHGGRPNTASTHLLQIGAAIICALIIQRVSLHHVKALSHGRAAIEQQHYQYSDAIG